VCMCVCVCFFRIIICCVVENFLFIAGIMGSTKINSVDGVLSLVLGKITAGLYKRLKLSFIFRCMLLANNCTV